MKKIFVLIGFISGSVFAQDTENFTRKEVIFLVGPTAGNINNVNITNDKYATSKGGNGINLGINYSYYFIKNVGINLGLEFNQFSNTTDYKTIYRATDLSVDRDGYLYYKQVEANYTDKRSMNTIDIPIALRLQSYNENFQVFLDAGVKMNIMLTSKFEEKGTYNNKGAYPLKNTSSLFLIDENDPYYNYTNSTYNTSHDLGANRVNFSFIVSGGIKAKISDKLFLIANPSYLLGLTDIMPSVNTTDYVNILQEKSPYKKSTLSQFALKVGVGIKL